MNSPDPVPTCPPAVIPWYQSAVLRGIIAAVVPQIITRAHQRFGIDLSLFGVDANAATDWVMDAISAGAIAYAAHARVAKPMPAVVLTKASAAAANQAVAADPVAPPAAQPNPK